MLSMGKSDVSTTRPATAPAVNILHSDGGGGGELNIWVSRPITSAIETTRPASSWMFGGTMSVCLQFSARVREFVCQILGWNFWLAISSAFPSRSRVESFDYGSKRGILYSSYGFHRLRIERIDHIGAIV